MKKGISVRIEEAELEELIKIHGSAQKAIDDLIKEYRASKISKLVNNLTEEEKPIVADLLIKGLCLADAIQVATWGTSENKKAL